MIVKATQADILPIMECYKATIKKMHELQVFQWDESYPTRNLIENDINNETYYIVKDGNEILGGVCLNQEEHPTYSTINWTFEGPVLVVHRLAINPLAQGRGIAKQLMQFAENLCVKNKMNGIRLDTFIENPQAIGLYLKLKYNKLGKVGFKNKIYYCFDKKIL